MFKRLIVRALELVPHVRRLRAELEQARRVLELHALTLRHPMPTTSAGLESRLRCYLATLVPAHVDFSVMVRRPSRGMVVVDAQVEGADHVVAIAGEDLEPGSLVQLKASGVRRG